MLMLTTINKRYLCQPLNKCRKYYIFTACSCYAWGMKVNILGCGASGGVPLIGCDCAVCRSDNPKNRRQRASIVIEATTKTVLVDTSPDLHWQALDAKLSHIDAVLFTHAHADHTHGIDELRSFNYHKNAPIDCYADAATLAELQARFAYVFAAPIKEYGWFRPALQPHEITLGDVIQLDALRVQTFAQDHGRVQTMGIRVGDFAYSTDVKQLDETAFKALEGVETWVVDCLQDQPTPTHADLALTLHWIERVQPKRAILTHMSHYLEYEALNARLPAHITPAYDGLVLEC